MMDITDIFNAGFFGLVVFGVGLILGIVGLVLVFGVRHRLTFVIYGLTALLPVLIGLFGTWMGYQSVQSIQLSAPNPEVLQEGYRVAWVTTYLGIAFSVPIIAIACIGFAIKKEAISTEN